ncbi:hypothetical protein MHYP_G00049220 [Metynnis hypsauchen]
MPSPRGSVQRPLKWKMSVEEHTSEKSPAKDKELRVPSVLRVICVSGKKEERNHPQRDQARSGLSLDQNSWNSFLSTKDKKCSFRGPDNQRSCS